MIISLEKYFYRENARAQISGEAFSYAVGVDLPHMKCLTGVTYVNIY